MVSVCPSCGIELEKNYKFCPNCGSSLKSDSSAASAWSDSPLKESTIICDVCGEENLSENKYCKGCGAKFSSASHADRPKSSDTQAPSLNKQKHIPSSVIKKANPPSSKVTVNRNERSSRSLSKYQLITIILGIPAIIFIFLYATGIFDSVPVNTTPPAQNSQVPQDQSSGVSLATLNEINALQEKVKSDPSDMQSVLQLGHLNMDAGLFEKAITYYRIYLAKNPSDADTRVDMGVCYFNLKDYKTAVAEMKTALKYKPKHQIAHLNLGIVNLAAGNLEESKLWLQKAVDLDSNSDAGKRAKELLESH